MFSRVLDDQTVLKPLAPHHAEELFKLTDGSRQMLREWLPWVDAITDVSHSSKFISGAVLQGAEKGAVTAGIWYQDQLAGIISYHEINWHDRSVSIGYWLGKGFEGQGLMRSAVRAFVDYALMEMELNRVEIRCATGNTRSRAIPERLGFVLEGVIREAEKLPQGYVNHAIYGMLKSEWERLR